MSRHGTKLIYGLTPKQLAYFVHPTEKFRQILSAAVEDGSLPVADIEDCYVKEKVPVSDDSLPKGFFRTYYRNKESGKLIE